MSVGSLERYLFRKERIRKKIFGTKERPRLSVYRSLNHIYAQIIDDSAGKTLVASSSLDSSIKKELKAGGNSKAAAMVGKSIAEKAVKLEIKKVVFDRGGRIFHGRVKALADGARLGGLEF
ncbi:MAG: 50S ribosomal protein L18 [Elusimicrobia bacterium RIFCSPLOWO2_02_FULL_39_32]|nr:MAG: 50S ribosomal protein L18 [Elusimicrobia bacterium RIFCSPHIGHO2_02_FULL_39_36]OGR93742.1 MAG: 50S ribosomal protein L18 [Elusimicrobia bacterium RIFCSPLOWO2_02_FULL_39_32]OGS00958.1 MAG: 50S ribosomal protein L18 [Elusimicrobia bacterium RIFCSPLOWO2_12_FULL_39_28]